ncbi:MAG: hypothetical protein HEEMFOPI_00425 [Holosporales bacterium]
MPPPPINGNSYIDIDLAQFQSYLTTNSIQTTSIHDFVGFLNAQFTTHTVPLTASVTNNQLTLTATDSTLGIAIGDVSQSQLEIMGSGSHAPFSEFFGLNNLFSVSSNLSDPDLINQISIRQDIVSNHGDGLSVGQIITDKPLLQNSSIIFGTAIAESISDSWKNDVLSFSATQTLGAKQMTLQDYLKTIISNHESIVSSTKETNDILEMTYDRATVRVSQTSKLSREEIQNQLYELAFFQKYVINMLEISYAMMDDIRELARR